MGHESYLIIPTPMSSPQAHACQTLNNTHHTEHMNTPTHTQHLTTHNTSVKTKTTWIAVLQSYINYSAKGFLSITGLINSKKKVRKNYSGYGFFKKKIQNKIPVTVFIFCQMVAQLHKIRRPPLARTVHQRPRSEWVDLCPLSTALVPLQRVIHIDQDRKTFSFAFVPELTHAHDCMTPPLCRSWQPR